MNRKAILWLAAAALLTTLPSCRFIRVSDELKQQLKENIQYDVNVDAGGNSITASSSLITRNDVTGSFHALQCSLPADMTYTPGECSLTIIGPDNILQHIVVNNESGTLSIKSDGTSFRNLKNLKMSLSSPVLETATFNGAVDFQAPQGITATDFKATVNGAGDINITGLRASTADITVNGAGDADITGIDCDSLTLNINGAGDATVAGSARKADLSISGAGDIDARGLRAEAFNSKVRGIGKIQKPKN